MAATMVDLMQQNQELTKEVNRHRRQCYGKEHEQNSENEGAKKALKEEIILEELPFVECHTWTKRWIK